mmetsp:Transcript_8492/g.25646  ORF Transcript_8492/g.25646 Transcript_8492/m.25646 type:complete len:570 (-) Transcript_8492:76-1785(-)
MVFSRYLMATFCLVCAELCAGTSDTFAVEDVRTVGYTPELLIKIRETLEEESPPDWAVKAKDALVRAAERVVDLPAGLRTGVPAGPWSVTQDSSMPPSNDNRDFYMATGYIWPCNMGCAEAGFTPDECTQWDTGLRTFGTCDTATGLPWVARDGFMNKKGNEDVYAMIVMMDTAETLTLAWWFAPDHNKTYAHVAAEVLRTWFLDEATAMYPTMLYSGTVPGHINGTAGGIIAPSFRLNSRVVDCIELLKLAGEDVWSTEDDAKWRAWAGQWLKWLQTSEFGKIELKSVGNHATYFMLHKIALAHAVNKVDDIKTDVGRLHSGLGGSMDQQIMPSGEMPIETSRVTGATYARMGLEAVFKLGVTAENACRGLQCSPGWDWSYSTPEQDAEWLVFSDKISMCRWKGAGDTSSLGACKASCLAHSECNGVVIRYVSGSLWDCMFKKCSPNDYELRDLTENEDRSHWVWENHMYKAPPLVGSGNLKEGLHYLLDYALAEDPDMEWLADHPDTLTTDAALSWSDLATTLRIGAAKYGEQSFEDSIQIVDPDGRFFSTHSADALIYPPAEYYSR